MGLGRWVGLLAIVISLYSLWQIRQVLLLLFAAIVFATVLNRLVRLLQRFHIKRGFAIFISVVLLLALLFGFFSVIVPPIIEQSQKLVDLVPRGFERLRAWFNTLQTMVPSRLGNQIRDLSYLTQNLQNWAAQLFGNLFAIFSNSVAVILNLLLVFVLTIMLLANPSQYRQIFILVFPSFYRRRVYDILAECEVYLIGWIRGTIFDMFVIGVVTYGGLLALQVQLPLVNALLAGLLEFIPNLGPTLSVIPPILLALLDAPWKAGAVLVLYILIQQFESNILVPLVMRSQASLLPAVTLLSVVIFTIFFGFLGLFLAIPLMIVFQVWLKEVLVKDILDKWQR
ncbi:MAG: AI-2E family transporter [Chroococcidiopsidaceae cyanobacterium CP_BM_RX_35]|nr:AI-2E family transporter [Chroococcidiopsidaceae cyanobacterium CP_BM_RX_35]